MIVIGGRRFSELNQVKVGLVGLVITACLVALALNAGALRDALESKSYTATFTESGGLKSGDDVRIAGVSVGTVRTVTLDGTKVEVAFHLSGLSLGDRTTAAIKAANALGRRYLAISPAGSGDEPSIPLARTTSPYGVTDALSDLTRTTQKIDTSQLARSFEAISQTFGGTPHDLRRALTGVGALSQTIASRDNELQSLLRGASGLTDVLAQRSADIQAIARDGDNLFAELEARRSVIHRLLISTRVASTQLSGLAGDNKDRLGPDLVQLRKASALLQRNQSSLDFILLHLGPFARSLGEAVGGGPFFYAFVENLVPTNTFSNELTLKLGQALQQASASKVPAASGGGRR